MTITKQQVILNHVVTNDRQAIFCERLDESSVPRRLSFKAGDWADMGSPETVTITIEPGDLLNDEAQAKFPAGKFFSSKDGPILASQDMTCDCGHLRAAHGPGGEKDCMCGKCMWFRPSLKP